MISIKEKRKKIEKLVLDFMSIVDKTGSNTDRYKEIFSNMSDAQFKKWMGQMSKDENTNFYMEVVPYKNEPELKDIMEGADFLGIPLEEYVYYQHDENKDNPIRSATKVPVGYLNMKRVQQILQKKNSYNLDTSKKNLKTGQITNFEKVG